MAAIVAATAQAEYLHAIISKYFKSLFHATTVILASRDSQKSYMLVFLSTFFSASSIALRDMPFCFCICFIGVMPRHSILNSVAAHLRRLRAGGNANTHTYIYIKHTGTDWRTCTYRPPTHKITHLQIIMFINRIFNIYFLWYAASYYTFMRIILTLTVTALNKHADVNWLRSGTRMIQQDEHDSFRFVPKHDYIRACLVLINVSFTKS